MLKLLSVVSLFTRGRHSRYTCFLGPTLCHTAETLSFALWREIILSNHTRVQCKLRGEAADVVVSHAEFKTCKTVNVSVGHLEM